LTITFFFVKKLEFILLQFNYFASKLVKIGQLAGLCNIIQLITEKKIL